MEIYYINVALLSLTLAPHCTFIYQFLFFKDIMENTVAYEKELEVLKSRKEEFAKIDTKLKKYETSITKTTKLNDLMKEKISDMTQAGIRISS